MGLVSVNVAVGKVDVSMIRSWNWLSRSDWSLFTCVRSTEKLPALTFAPLMVMEPVIAAGAADGGVGLAEQRLLDAGTRSRSRKAIFHVPSVPTATRPVSPRPSPAVAAVAGGRDLRGRRGRRRRLAREREWCGRLAFDEVDEDERAAHEPGPG